MFPPAEKNCLESIKKRKSSCIARATKVSNISKEKMILWLYTSTFSHFNILFKSRECTVKYCLLHCSFKLVCQGRTGNCHEYELSKKQALKLCQCYNPYLLMCYSKFEWPYKVGLIKPPRSTGSVLYNCTKYHQTLLWIKELRNKLLWY